ncbi:MAG: UbiD family decarboxylase [Desulfobacterota bacterium]|nr:UbiD family decarboxylase [Thermodesulfobacteriota bacterium]
MKTHRTLRDFVKVLRKEGELLSLSKPFDPKYEISAVISELGKRKAPAVLFRKAKGFEISVVGNLFGTIRRLSLALGLEEERLLEDVIPRLEKRIPPVSISEDPADWVSMPKGKVDLLKVLPALTHYSKDTGPYITSGISSARDPETGVTGRGLHRMEVRGKDTLGISLLNPPLADIYAMQRKAGKKKEIATVIGVPPAVFIASIFKVPAGTDKLSVAGGLMGEPVETTMAETVDLDIPARGEIVIEGYIDPKDKEEDGTLGESSGYYMAFGKSPTIHVTGFKYRKGALYHAVVPWAREVDSLLYLVHGLDFIPKMRKEIPSLRRIHLAPMTFGSHVVMSMDTDHKGEIRRALTLALSFTMVKKVVVVDVDVDPQDGQEVEWALATRFQADRDLIVIPELRGQPIDPSSKWTGEGFLTTKTGLDATRPKKEGFEKVDVPEEVKRRLSPVLKDLMGRIK